MITEGSAAKFANILNMQDKDREFSVVLEGLRSDFRAFGEGLSIVHRRADETNKRIDETNNRIDNTNKQLKELTHSFLDFSDFMKQMLQEHEQWLKNHEVRLKQVETQA